MLDSKLSTNEHLIAKNDIDNRVDQDRCDKSKLNKLNTFQIAKISNCDQPFLAYGQTTKISAHSPLSEPRSTMRGIDVDSFISNSNFHCHESQAWQHSEYFNLDQELELYDDDDDFPDKDVWFISSKDTMLPAGNCEQIVPPTDTDEKTHDVFMEAFIQNNRLEHISQIMGYHPDYLKNFLTTQNFLLREDGPLPYDYRHYIAIMAAARHQCSYLIDLHERDFIRHNGNPEWLKGIEFAPKKLQNLYEINKVLAHQPWLITKNHMVFLLKDTKSERWSLSELMQAIILLTHFHALCSFVYGCGINPELDLEGGFTYKTSTSPHSEPEDSDENTDTKRLSTELVHTESPRGEDCVGVNDLVEKMRQLTENSEIRSPEELLRHFQSVEHNCAEISVPDNQNGSPQSEIQRYVIEPEFSYLDFVKQSQLYGIPTFRARDYSWEDHGFSLANRLYSEIGDLLEDKYAMASNLTYYTMGDKCSVDTSSFRRAIWNYIHCLYGLMHDDYDYSQVNKLLERNLKAYIKILTCYPERLKKKEYDNVMREFKHSEKVHVNLMLMEARQQGELLYALRALNQYIT